MMKRLSVLFVILFASATLARAQDWSAGARLGSGFQGVAQRHLASGNYLEGRLGMGWIYGGITADFSVLHVWNVMNREDMAYDGNWFFDLGAGVNLGGASNFFHGGIQGMAKVGYSFADVPIDLSFDWSPAFGPEIVYFPSIQIGGIRVPYASRSSFNARGLANFGLSCVYRF